MRTVTLTLSLLLVVSFCTPATARGDDWPPAPPLERPAQRDVGLMPPSVSAEHDKSGLWNVTFRFRPTEPARTVTLAGTFNSWSPAADAMTEDGKGNWSKTIRLGPGRYLYKFVVNDGAWHHDPRNTVKEPDGHGGSNSVLSIGRLATMNHSTGTVGDGEIGAIGLLHSPQMPLYFQPLGGDRAVFRYRTLAHDVTKVWVAIEGGGLTEMQTELEDELFATWEAVVELPDSTRSKHTPGMRQVSYTFVLADPGRRVSDPELYLSTFAENEIMQTPEWAKNAIWYQIMPDRFRNGTTENDPDPVRPWTSEWFTPSPWEEKDGNTFYKYYVFYRLYGGDFQGVEEKLVYLKELGVNAIYFNPIFQAPTHHKYDADNYLHVDGHLGSVGDYEQIVATEDLNDPSTWQWTGSDKIFLSFIKKAHAMGFRVIIDGVFNHVGRRHPAFQDVLKNGKNSKYADWFDVRSWEPFEYRGWAGHDSLPVFKKSADGLASDSVKQHIFNVTRRWMDPDGDGDPSDGIDGWRLDVPNEIAAPFWVEWREVVKSVNPDAYITGEIWDRADMWLDGKHFDAVMNYEFARAAVAWICHRDQRIMPSQIDRRLAKLRLAYPAAATYVMQNLVDSHDTDRIVSMVLNPDRNYDKMNRVQDDNPNYDNAKPGADAYQRVRLVALLQMTYVGAPMVYYGDEVGMWGADDPTNRKPMLWEDLQPYEQPEENFVMKDQLAFYKQAIALRNAHPALRTGSFHTLLTDDQSNVWAFERADENERMVVILNASDSTCDVAVPDPAGTETGWRVVFGDEAALLSADAKLTVRVPAMSGVVLQAASGSK